MLTLISYHTSKHKQIWMNKMLPSTNASFKIVTRQGLTVKLLSDYEICRPASFHKQTLFFASILIEYSNSC